MSYVGIDAQGARALGLALQDTAGRVDDVRRSVSDAAVLSDLGSEVAVELARVLDRYMTTAAGLTGKAAEAEQRITDPRATAAGLRASVDAPSPAISGLLGFAGPTDVRQPLVTRAVSLEGDAEAFAPLAALVLASDGSGRGGDDRGMVPLADDASVAPRSLIHLAGWEPSAQEPPDPPNLLGAPRESPQKEAVIPSLDELLGSNTFSVRGFLPTSGLGGGFSYSENLFYRSLTLSFGLGVGGSLSWSGDQPSDHFVAGLEFRRAYGNSFPLPRGWEDWYQFTSASGQFITSTDHAALAKVSGAVKYDPLKLQAGGWASYGFGPATNWQRTVDWGLDTEKLSFKSETSLTFFLTIPLGPPLVSPYPPGWPDETLTGGWIPGDRPPVGEPPSWPYVPGTLMEQNPGEMTRRLPVLPDWEPAAPVEAPTGPRPEDTLFGPLWTPPETPAPLKAPSGPRPEDTLTGRVSAVSPLESPALAATPVGFVPVTFDPDAVWNAGLDDAWTSEGEDDYSDVDTQDVADDGWDFDYVPVQDSLWA